MKYQMLKSCKPWLWLCFALSLIVPQVANAFGLPNGNLEFAVPKSDVVCIGTIKSISTSRQSVFSLSSQFTIDCKDASAEVSVETVLSGNFSGTHLHLSYPAYLSAHRLSLPAIYYPYVAVGERAILFLSKQPSPEGNETASFLLYSPFAQPAPIVPIGEATLISVSDAVTPLRRIALTMTYALDVPDKAIRLDCLQRLRSVGSLLYVKPGIYSDEYGVKSRLAFGEAILTPQSASSSLEQFVKSQILPKVVSLMKDTDVSEQAFITAGYLQDVDIIPDLVKIADKHDAASLAIGNYRTNDAVRPLINALASKNNDVRENAADALRNFADPLAIPFLLDHLDDPSPDAQYYIVTALFTATNTPRYPGTELFHEKASEYIVFWKKWGVEHQDRVKALRAQFEAAVPAKSTL